MERISAAVLNLIRRTGEAMLALAKTLHATTKTLGTVRVCSILAVVCLAFILLLLLF